jgi:isopenicillin N synthase-like dioxygenase
VTIRVPVIDIEPFRTGSEEDKQQVATDVAAACAEIGFLVITGHGVPDDVVDGLYEVNKRYFESPLDVKQAAGRPSPGQIRGYSGVESEGLGLLEDEPVPPDLKESFDVGPLDVDRNDPYYVSEAAGDHFAPNVWPDIAGFEDAYRHYYDVMESLTLTMVEIFALALDVPATYFKEKLDRQISILRSNYYPQQVNLPKPGQLRGGAHSDYTALTILWQEDVPAGGLEVRSPDGEWVGVPVVPGSFVVNLGDSMMRWTNDTWISTMHRVVNPPAEIAKEHSRMSVAHFVQPNYDALIECIASCQSKDRPAKYPPVLNGDFLYSKFMQQNTLVNEAAN